MPSELPQSEILVLLAKRRRRLALRALRESSTPLTLGDLADRIVESECEDPTEADRRAVYTSLYHNHLPKLEDADVIEYEERVAPGVNFDTVVDVQERVTERERPWSDA